MILSRSALLNPQDVNTNLPKLLRKGRTACRGCPRLTLCLLLRVEGKNICRGDDQGSCRLVCCSTRRRELNQWTRETVNRLPEQQSIEAVSLDAAVLSPLLIR